MPAEPDRKGHLTRGQIVELSLNLLEEQDRRRIEELAQMLVLEIPARSVPARVQFGPRMAYELLWAIGHWMRRSGD